MPVKKYNIIRAYNGKNALRKRVNTVKAVTRYAKQGVKAYKKYAPMVRTAVQGPTAGSFSGMGDYKVRKTTVGRGIGPRAGSRVHTHHHKGAEASLEKGAMRIKHSEYLGDLIVPAQAAAGSTGFGYTAYGINPGNQAAFPWLSGIAINFQHYKFAKLVYEFNPLIADGATSANNSLLSMGSVIMGTQYNSINGAYTSKQTMAESDYAVTVKPSQHCLHAIECDPKFNPLGIMYVSSNQGLTQGQVNGVSDDIRFQNLGIFQIAYSGVPVAANASVNLGEIWVHYEVILEKPQLNAGLTNLLSAHYTDGPAGGGASTNNPFGAVGANAQPITPVPGYTYNGQPIVQNQTLSLYFSVVPANGGGRVTFPSSITAGRFLMYYVATGTANGSIALTWQNPIGCTLIQSWPTGANDFIATFIQTPASGVAASNGQASCVCIVDISAQSGISASVDLQAVTLPTGGNWQLYVTPWNVGLW